MSDTCVIRPGMSIMIRRTDGRTHPAIIATVNPDMENVNVEWFEEDEMKGKEIDFEEIFDLNPNLTAPPSSQPNLNTAHQLSFDSSTSRDEDEEEEDDDQCEDDRRNELLSTAGDNGNSKTESSMPASSLPNPRTSRTEAHLPLQAKNRQIKAGPSSSYTVSSNGFSVPSNDTNLSEIVHNNPMPTAQPTSDAIAEGRKRNNVVKEVEKLKKNREERRLRQAEKKEAQMNIDPGNPNWQTLQMIRDYQNSLTLRPLRRCVDVETRQINVCVRKRPLNKKELARKEVDVVTVPTKDVIVVHEPKNKVDLTKYLDNQHFRFDHAFDDTCSNELVYHYTAKPLVETVFKGGMATCFAYGQTGSGKTHTMGGTFSGKHQDSTKGIYAMVAKDVFEFLNSSSYREQNFVVSASFFEIYGGKVFDLLANKAKLRVLEDGRQQVQIVGLTEKVVNSVEEVLALIASGNAARTSGQTSANPNSSRSHAVFQITLRTPGSHRVSGKFSLIDLAGNERGADTSSADKVTRMEGAEINKSLLALKECIRALGRKGAHLPFRTSKLTHVLRDSFIGDNSKTCMIAMISPGMSSCEHSLNTLRYADRVKELVATDLPESEYDGRVPESMPFCIDPAAPKEPNSDERFEGPFEMPSIDVTLTDFPFPDLPALEMEVQQELEVWQMSGYLEDDLLEMLKKDDYNRAEFVPQLDFVLNKRLRLLNNLLEKAKKFRRHVKAEERI